MPLSSSESFKPSYEIFLMAWENIHNTMLSERKLINAV